MFCFWPTYYWWYLNFGQNAHVRSMCVWPKIECACDPYIRRNSHFEFISDKQKRVFFGDNIEQCWKDWEQTKANCHISVATHTLNLYQTNKKNVLKRQDRDQAMLKKLGENKGKLSYIHFNSHFEFISDKQKRNVL